MGSRLGTVKEVERRNKKDDINMFMRVQVALPITKPLRRGGFIAGSDGERTWVSFKYERLPMFCHFCGILGHDLKHCAAHYAVEKQGGQVEYQYGDFLNAAGSRPRAPTSKNTNPMSHTKEGNGSAAKQSSSYFMNQGMDAKNTHVNSVSHEFHANVKGINAEKGKLSPDILLTGQLTTKLNAESVKGLDQSDLGKIFVYSRSIINTYSLLSHKWWVPLINFMVGLTIHVRE